MDLTPYYQGADRRLFQQVNPSLAGMPEREGARQIESMEEATSAIIKNMGDRVEKMDEITNKGNLSSGENEKDELIGQYKEFVAKNPFAFKEHEKLADKLAGKIRGINREFTNDEYSSHFESWKESAAAKFLINSSEGVIDGKLRAGKQSWEARINSQMARGDYAGAAETRRAGGGTFEPAEAAEEGAKVYEMKGTVEEFKKESTADPLAFKSKLDDPRLSNSLPFDVYADLQMFNNRNLNKLKAEKSTEYQKQIFENKPINVDQLEKDVQSGVIDVDYAIQLKGNLARRDAALLKGNAERNKYVTDPKAYLHTEDMLGNYDRLNDLEGQDYAKAERFINAAQLSEGHKKYFMGRLNDMQRGKPSDPTTQLVSNLKSQIKDMFDDQRLIKWKNDFGELEEKNIAAYDKGRAMQFELFQFIEKKAHENPKATFEEGNKWIGEYMSQNGNRGNIPRVKNAGLDALYNDDLENKDVTMPVNQSASDIRKQNNQPAIPQQVGTTPDENFGLVLPPKDGGDYARQIYDMNFNGMGKSEASSYAIASLAPQTSEEIMNIDLMVGDIWDSQNLKK